MADAPGNLVENIMHFGRVLRAAGLPLGPGAIIDAVRAVQTAGIGRREDFYWALHAVFVHRREERELFDQAFHIFWRDPQLLERMMSTLLPEFHVPRDQDETLRRLADALRANRNGDSQPRNERVEQEFDAAFSYSDREVLQTKDFEDMTAEEIVLAKAAIARLRLPIMEVATRRLTPAGRGRRVDMRQTLRASLRTGGDIIPLRHRAPARKHPPLVVLCDISGSMSRYSRMFLHFMHAITSDRDRVHSFVFGTRLTNITRHLRTRDVDLALNTVARVVEDWAGGTRLGACLKDFNQAWSRRVLGQGAVVLLITDGLDRDGGHGLEAQADRLHRSCRRLVWLNPLLRFEGFAPKSMGIRALLPHVDEFRPAHNLASLEELSQVLSRPQASTPGASLEHYRALLREDNAA